jgi:hypothetical protein
MIIENASFGYAFSRAFKLISNNWWITAGAVFIVWLIAYCMMFFISLPLSLVNVSSMLLRPQTMPHCVAGADHIRYGITAADAGIIGDTHHRHMPVLF